MDSETTREQFTWHDRFSTPTPTRLRAELVEPSATLFDQVRTGLAGAPNVRESLLWYGAPWRWTLTYTCREAEIAPWAYLIPDPASPQLAIALTCPTLEAVQLRKLSKPVREGLLQAPSVDGVIWAQWELNATQNVQELLDLAHRQRESLHHSTE